MKVPVDTDVLVRAVLRDDPVQADVATKVLTDAELIAVAMPCLCEFVSVLRRVYDFKPADTAAAIHALLAVAKVEINRPAAEAGLSVLEAGGGCGWRHFLRGELAWPRNLRFVRQEGGCTSRGARSIRASIVRNAQQALV